LKDDCNYLALAARRDRIGPREKLKEHQVRLIDRIAVAVV